MIKQQAEQGVLDFKAYADFVIQIMAKSCAPIRDQEIEDLSKLEDVVETFRGIMEVRLYKTSKFKLIKNKFESTFYKENTHIEIIISFNYITTYNFCV